MRRRIKIVKNRILAVLLSVILAASCLLILVRPVEASAIGLDLALSGSTTVGEMLYGLFATAGLTTLAVNRDSDSLFSNKYSLDNLVETGKLVPVDGSYKNASWDDVMNDIKSDAEAGNSSFAKNMVVPVTVSYEKLAGGLPGPTPTPGGGTLVKSGLQWLGKRLQMLAMAGMISVNLLAGTPDMSTVLQDYAQPQVEYSMSADMATQYADVIANMNVTVPDGYSQFGFLFSNSSDVLLMNYPSSYLPVYTVSNRSLSFYSKDEFGVTKNIYSFRSDGSSGYSSIRIDKSPSCSYGYKAFALPSYHCSPFGRVLVLPTFSDLLNFDFDGYDFSTNLQSSSDLVNNNGNVSDVNSIQPAINPDQAMRVPSADAIQNYITNQNNTTNQNDIINNYNNFVNNYIMEAPVEPIEPVEPDVPVVPDMPAVDPDPQPSPPAEDDENNSYLSPNLKEYFPFCIPWDIASIFQNFTAERKAPKFTFTLKSEKFGFSEDIVVDLSTFDSVASILRLLELILFIIALATATRALIGAL